MLSRSLLSVEDSPIYSIKKNNLKANKTFFLKPQLEGEMNL